MNAWNRAAKLLAYRFAHRREWHISEHETNETSWSAKVAVAMFLGSVRIEWQQDRKEMGL